MAERKRSLWRGAEEFREKGKAAGILLAHSDLEGKAERMAVEGGLEVGFRKADVYSIR